MVLARVFIIAAVLVHGCMGVVDQTQTASVTTFKIPAAGVWQSFTPSWTDSLTAIDIFLGASIPSSPCVPFKGTLAVYLGEGAKTNSDYYVGKTPLLTQAVEGTAGSCVCDSVNCVGWQQFILQAPVAVTAGQTYSFYISHDTSASLGYRVGLMVADAYASGQNYFQMSGYDFAFRTYMQQANPNALPSSSDSKGSSQSSSGGNTLSVGLGLGIGIGCVVALFAFLVVYNRRRPDGWVQPAKDGQGPQPFYQDVQVQRALRHEQGAWTDNADSSPAASPGTQRRHHQLSDASAIAETTVDASFLHDGSPTNELPAAGGMWGREDDAADLDHYAVKSLPRSDHAAVASSLSSPAASASKSANSRTTSSPGRHASQRLRAPSITVQRPRHNVHGLAGDSGSDMISEADVVLALQDGPLCVEKSVSPSGTIAARLVSAPMSSPQRQQQHGPVSSTSVSPSAAPVSVRLWQKRSSVALPMPVDANVDVEVQNGVVAQTSFGSMHDEEA